MDVRISTQFDFYTIDITEVPASKLDAVIKGATELAFGKPKADADKEFIVSREDIITAIKTHFNNGHNPQYINAIKFVRILTRMNLAKAKSLVDEVRAANPPWTTGSSTFSSAADLA